MILARAEEYGIMKRYLAILLGLVLLALVAAMSRALASLSRDIASAIAITSP